MKQIFWNYVSRCVLGEGRGGSKVREIKRKRGVRLHGHLFIMRCSSWMHSMVARGTCSLHYTCRTGEDRICDWRKKEKWTCSYFSGLTGYPFSSVIWASSYLLEVTQSRGGQKKDESGMLMMLICRGDLSSLTEVGE